jgi:decaprenyl-phosphate phosphoribosyltransferase
MTSSTEIAVRPSRLPAAIRAMRPRQWVKIILVASAPLAAGQLFAGSVLA